jgi:flavin-dependent dehydrogenase
MDDMFDVDWLEWSDIDRKQERETIILEDEIEYKTVEANGTTHVLSEDMAMNLYFAIAREFRWAVTLFTPRDVRDTINLRRENDEKEPLEGIELEEAVNTITDSRDWDRWLPDYMTEQGWEVIHQSIFENLEYEDN